MLIGWVPVLKYWSSCHQVWATQTLGSLQISQLVMLPHEIVCIPTTQASLSCMTVCLSACLFRVEQGNCSLFSVQYPLEIPTNNFTYLDTLGNY